MAAQGRKKLLNGYDKIILNGLKVEMSHLLGLTCDFIMDTRERPFGGSECVVVVLQDTAGSKWAVRFPLQFHQYPKHVEMTILKEVELRLAIESKMIAGIPKLKTFNASFNNPARFPFCCFHRG